MGRSSRSPSSARPSVGRACDDRRRSCHARAAAAARDHEDGVLRRCQLTLLDLEDHLLDVLGRFDLVEFAEASDRPLVRANDIVLVEGSVSTAGAGRGIVRIRRETPMLVTIGACATRADPGPPQLGGPRRVPGRGLPAARVRGVAATAKPTPTTSRSTRSSWVPDRPGAAARAADGPGRRPTPSTSDEAVCLECKRRGIVCVLVTGVGPASARNAHGLRRPVPGLRTRLLRLLRAEAEGERHQPRALVRAGWAARRRHRPPVRGFTAYAKPFREVIDALGGPPVAAKPGGNLMHGTGLDHRPALRGRRPDPRRG